MNKKQLKNNISVFMLEAERDIEEAVALIGKSFGPEADSICLDDAVGYLESAISELLGMKVFVEMLLEEDICTPEH